MNTMVGGQVFEGVVVVDNHKTLVGNAFSKKQFGKTSNDTTRLFGATIR